MRQWEARSSATWITTLASIDNCYNRLDVTHLAYLLYGCILDNRSSEGNIEVLIY